MSVHGGLSIIISVNEMLLTVEQAAKRLQLRPITIREQLKRGTLRGIKRGHQWRIPESALFETPSRPKTWAEAAERMSPLYALSLAAENELTEITTAPDEKGQEE